ncbi:hypothetical protein Vau01_119070 [Virgisporangium aurantiacum]|uniref:HTH hxlR-type domain-containing protein n=1 Tax=Virgisporangium aurantiacum TaxID=175570 RepID=A0A8J4E7C3_9ACTN|nr:hypothetical protein Vau01_119070 [Virgisporangium aurantiacum]
MSGLDSDGLREKLPVLRRRWDPVVLTVLCKDGPQRRRNLSQTVVDEGERIADGVLSEVLNRLQQEGFVAKETRSPNVVLYEATEAARDWVEWLRRVTDLSARAGKGAIAVTDDSSTHSAVDTTKPSSARVWNYLLGGKDNFEIDRKVGDEVRDANPQIATLALEQRKFLVRAVTYLAAEAGIEQFLDVGTGLPTANNTHEVAQRIAPKSRIVYVDNDPLVLVNARALLVSSPEGATDYIESDVEDPDKILRQAARTLDFSKPIGLTMLGILGNVADYDEARSILKRLVDVLSAGSYVVVCDGTSTSQENVDAVRIASEQGHPYNLRTLDQITGFFFGLDLLEPGVVPLTHWRPEVDPLPPAVDCYCGVALKR